MYVAVYTYLALIANLYLHKKEPYVDVDQNINPAILP